MAAPSKIKGNTAERALCLKLGEIFGGTFKRVPTSGAMTGGVNKFKKIDKNQEILLQGDIIPPDHMPNLRLESKFYATFSFESIVYGKDNAQLTKWIEQAEFPDKIWFLICRFNRKGSFILSPNRGYTYKNYCVWNGYYITELDTFLEDNKDLILEQTKIQPI